MVSTMLGKMLISINRLGNPQKEGAEVEVDLFSWCRSAMSVASTEAVYGPENPYTHESGLIEAFW